MRFESAVEKSNKMEFNKIIKNIFGTNQEINPFEDKEYLLKIYEKLEIAKNEQKLKTFTIEKLLNSGYQVKVNGVYGFIHFRQMPWTYSHVKSWTTIFPYLKGKAFKGKIFELSISDKISVKLDATASYVSTPSLEEKVPYKCIVLNKLNYGLILELGSNYNWESGSVTGFAHKSSLLYDSEFENAEIGDEITTYFQGFNQESKVMMGDKVEDKEWVSHEIDKYLGTTQIVRRNKNEADVTQFYFNDIRCVLPVSREFYQNNFRLVRNYLRGLTADDEIKCDIVRIIYAKKKFEVKINEDFLNNLIEESLGDLKIYEYVGTTQIIKMKVKNEFRAKYILNDIFECALPLTLKYYPTNKKEIIEYISNGQDKEFECKIVGIKKATKQPILRLTNDLIADILNKKQP